MPLPLRLSHSVKHAGLEEPQLTQIRQLLEKELQSGYTESGFLGSVILQVRANTGPLLAWLLTAPLHHCRLPLVLLALCLSPLTIAVVSPSKQPLSVITCCNLVHSST